MLVRQRIAKRPKPQPAPTAKSYVKQHKENLSRGRTRTVKQQREDAKVFQQPALNTRALDQSYEKRKSSVSPLKHRPLLDMEGLQAEECYIRKNYVYDQAKLNQHETVSQYSPEVMKSESRMRSQSRSILKNRKDLGMDDNYCGEFKA